MFEINIEFRGNVLYVSLEGIINKESVKKLKKRLYYIIEEYHIFEIIIDTKKCVSVDKESFYNFLDEYDINYGGDLVVTE